MKVKWETSAWRKRNLTSERRYISPGLKFHVLTNCAAARMLPPTGSGTCLSEREGRESLEDEDDEDSNECFEIFSEEDAFLSVPEALEADDSMPFLDDPD